MKYTNTWWYSVILAILMVGFMLILTSWVFLLVLWENKDTKAMEYYLKSFAGAEWSIELALLKAKKYNYSYSEKLSRETPLSKVLFRGNGELYNFNKDVFISYDLDATDLEIKEKKLPSGKFDIIPLFYFDIHGNNKKVHQLKLEGVNQEVVWNIIWETGGISWLGNFTNATEWNHKTISGNEVSYSKKKVGDFLVSSSNNYLILHNTSGNDGGYNLSSLIPGEFLTKETSYVVGTGEVWWYKQNLRVKIDNSQYLNLLKYSIFSNE